MPQVVGSRQAGLSQHNPDNNEHGNPQTIELIVPRQHLWNRSWALRSR